MQPNNAREVSPQQRYMTLMILWGAFFFNIVLFLVLAIVIAPDSSKLTYNRVLVIALTALGTFTALASVFFRKKMTAQAFEQQRPQSVSSAYIVAFALCEVAALCGVMLRFTTSDPYYYVLFIISVVGFLLNKPKRDDIINALSVKRI